MGPSGVLRGIRRIPASGFFWQRILTSAIINKHWTFKPSATPVCVYPPPFLAIHHWWGPKVKCHAMEQVMPKQIGYRPLLAHAITLVILTTLLCALVIKYLSDWFASLACCDLGHLRPLPPPLLMDSSMPTYSVGIWQQWSKTISIFCLMYNRLPAKNYFKIIGIVS